MPMRRWIYDFVTGPRFGAYRLAAWVVQIPIAITTSLQSSVAYLVFLSLAALVESALTDVIEGWKFTEES
jgi:hypothetical protein